MPSKMSAVERNPLARGCEGCFFLSNYFGCCNYLIYTDKRRPCPGGESCTVKTVPGKNWRKYAQKRNAGGRRVQWDTEKARKMRDQGISWAEVARAVGVSKGCLCAYAKRHWRGER